MNRGGQSVIEERGRSRSFLYQKRGEQSEQKMNISPCSSRGQRRGAAIVAYAPWSMLGIVSSVAGTFSLSSALNHRTLTFRPKAMGQSASSHVLQIGER
jgi:hypothetical protein